MMVISKNQNVFGGGVVQPLEESSTLHPQLLSNSLKTGVTLQRLEGDLTQVSWLHSWINWETRPCLTAIVILVCFSKLGTQPTESTLTQKFTYSGQVEVPPVLALQVPVCSAVKI